ncbi:arginase family protein [Bacillus sp. FJAT-27445]|uniref:arginase family protein n=1 Tax=Bacillus sp. FJAT-27445 TaxID=1679166 RepID=UPI000743C134|nr:arginase family protein [Bacillus sp. FJAT-27445]
MKIIVSGIPSSAGALIKGTELAPVAIRQGSVVRTLREQGYLVEDRGDLLKDKELPRHNIAPVRNWPAPRLVWEEIVEETESLFNKDAFSLILGGDCSLVVGTFTAFRKIFGDNTYLVVIDGHLDTVAPDGNSCIGAAGMGLWFLTQDKKIWWTEDPIAPGRIKAIGTHSAGEPLGIEITPYEDLQTGSVNEKLALLLEDIPIDASILVHFDVDVLHERIMPAAYSPSQIGLDLPMAFELFSFILKDQRVKGIEITEFAANKEGASISTETITNLIVAGLKVKAQLSVNGEQP